jgi:hypothetical protein
VASKPWQLFFRDCPPQQGDEIEGGWPRAAGQYGSQIRRARHSRVPSRHESEQAAKADRRSGARDAIAWRMLALSDEGLAHLAIAADARLQADARGRDGGVREELTAGSTLREANRKNIRLF